jgi:uncharacterized membrane protein YjdF
MSTNRWPVAIDRATEPDLCLDVVRTMTIPSKSERSRTQSAHLLLVGAMQLVLAVELLALAARGHWLHVFLVTGVMAICLTPVLFRKRLPVEVPSEIQIAVVLFTFATLFLGEVWSYYERFWWWDLALHGTAGLLLGLFGFLTVYMLNENRAVDLHMRPSFVALFAFFFAVGIGALWEIFEFGMDQIFGLTMQKPMFGDPSGLTDTMWDLILDTLGAAIVSVLGWRYLKRVRRAPVEHWFGSFIARNSGLFGK